MSISGRRGWFRVWVVASVIWVAASIWLQLNGYFAEPEPPLGQRLGLLADPTTGRPYPVPSKWDVFWRDARVALIVVGPPLAVPALVLLALWVSGWIRAGFADGDRE